MANVISPLESGQFISENSKHVSINTKSILPLAEKMAELFRERTYSLKNYKQHELHPKEANDEAVNWIFLVDTLNFCFWFPDGTEKFTVEYNGKRHTGYWSLCAAINRAIKIDKLPILDPKFYRSISLEQLKKVFRSDTNTDIPLLEKRLENLNEAGKILCEEFDGSFVKCITLCGGSAQKLLKLVVDKFSSYRDQCTYKGQTVSFYKRAQILIADIWACFEGQGLGYFGDIDTLTMFADYRIPQSLVHFGVLQYSDELMAFLKSDNLLSYGDDFEVEIRGNCIWSVQLIYEEVQKLLTDSGDTDIVVNMALLDHYLWDFRRAHAAQLSKIPFHKIRSIYY